MRNTKTVCDQETFQRMSIMFGTDTEKTKESLDIQFHASGVKPTGGNREQTHFKGALTHPLGC